MPLAFDIRDRMRQSSVRRAITNAVIAATALDEQVDIVRIMNSVTQRLPEARHRAQILSNFAVLLTENNQTEKAMRILVLALDNARLAGRDTVMEVLANNADSLATVDNGELLIRICNELELIDGWFVAVEKSHVS